jgi:hypothetical protein
VDTSPETLKQQLIDSRPKMLRFVLFWLLCVIDKDAASKTAFTMLRENEVGAFPDKLLYNKLCEEELAIPLQAPETIRNFAISTRTTGLPICSWGSRFEPKETDTPGMRDSRKLYASWFHRKDLLLWLQRRTLELEFNDANPLAGREEETPYDYDHICPQNDWQTDYRSYTSPFKHFCEYKNAGVVGHSIGNLRVEESSSNRHNQDDPAPQKLGLAEIDSDKTNKLLENSAIELEEAEMWKKCSTAKDAQGNWQENRALAFQEAVETRSFRLFEKYFKEGGFDEWNLTPSQTGKPATEIENKIG